MNTVLDNFRESMAFAKLDSGDKIEEENGSVELEKSDELDGEEPQMPAMTVPPSGQQQASFPLDEGQVLLQWPNKLSQASLEDFEAWLDVLVNRLRRSVNLSPKQPDELSDSSSDIS